VAISYCLGYRLMALRSCRLDNFLNYLQRYVLQKPQLPISIDFALSDTLEALRYVLF
jgi:hypothetical protein